MNKEEFDYEYTKNVFVSSIDDSYTLNLAISVLEDKQSLIYDNLILSQNNINLKQALNEIRELASDYVMCASECRRVLQIIDKVLGDEK